MQVLLSYRNQSSDLQVNWLVSILRQHWHTTPKVLGLLKKLPLIKKCKPPITLTTTHFIKTKELVRFLMDSKLIISVKCITCSHPEDKTRLQRRILNSIKLLLKKVGGEKLLPIFVKSTILYVCQGTEYTAGLHVSFTIGIIYIFTPEDSKLLGGSSSVNPFLPNVPFRFPENIRKPKVFWCFQGDQKRTFERKGLKLGNGLIHFRCSIFLQSFLSVLQNLAIFTEKHLSWILFLITLQAWSL